MNPSSTRIWNIPPPPGTEEDLSNTSSKKDGSVTSGSRAIDHIDPYLKSTDYIEFERKCSSERSKYRSKTRSRSRDRHHRRRHSRSRSRDRYRRSRSRSHRRHRRQSASKSISRSPSYRHSRRRYDRHRRSRHSRSRSRSTSRAHSHRLHRSRTARDKKSPTTRKSQDQKPVLDADINEVDMKIEEEEEEEEETDPMKDNVFKNDGSFLEMFKKMQEQQQQKAEETLTSNETTKPPIPVFGKRRGGKVLKTGLVQKVRLTNEEESNAQDAWSVYMKEVRRYKEACCDDDSKTRPLVK